MAGNVVVVLESERMRLVVASIRASVARFMVAPQEGTIEAISEVTIEKQREKAVQSITPDKIFVRIKQSHATKLDQSLSAFCKPPIFSLDP
jgi:hypothetical protein